MFYLVGAGYLLNLTLQHGMVWYIFSMSIITLNDIAAYMCGFFCGATPLIVLSPKKTVEGFLAAASSRSASARCWPPSSSSSRS